MPCVMHSCLVENSPHVSNFFFQEFIVGLKRVDLVLQTVSLLLSTDAKFFNNLEHPPQTHHDDQRSNFLDDTVQYNISDEPGNDNERIETVEPRIKIASAVSDLGLRRALKDTDLQPNAQTDAISSTMNRHENTKLMEPRISRARSQSGPSLPCSHLNRLRMKSADISSIPCQLAFYCLALTSNHAQDIQSHKAEDRVMADFGREEALCIFSCVPDGPCLAPKGMRIPMLKIQRSECLLPSAFTLPYQRLLFVSAVIVLSAG